MKPHHIDVAQPGQRTATTVHLSSLQRAKGIRAAARCGELKEAIPKSPKT
ncbi:MAG: hypothetical protein HY298_17275 [Verrucomicrobia bacterium]|nr:hypothetical protein [Verrucomicrobiota bacterium]